MNEKKRSRRDFIQNISIAVLTVSAVLLFVQSQVYHLGASSSFSRLFSGPDVQTSAVITPQQDESSLWPRSGSPLQALTAVTVMWP